MSPYFKMEEFSGDGAYASRKNTQIIADRGAIPYFKLRKDARALSKGYPAWTAMVRASRDNKKMYDERYHKRSVVESVYSAFKRKVSSHLKSKTNVAKTNEALCIAVAHNLFVLVNGVFCRDIDVEFRR